MIFADVILPLPLKNVFTYEVPEDFQDIEVGMRVIVQFGAKKFYTALVYSIHDKAPSNYIAKQIQDVLDSQAIVSETQFELWNWMASYYCCGLGDIMNSALPSALKLTSETKLILESVQFLKSDLTDQEFLVVEALEQRGELTLKEVSAVLNKKTIFPTINTLLKRKVISLLEEINEKYRAKTIRKVKMVDEGINELALKNAKKQKLIVDHFIKLGEELGTDAVAVSHILKSASATHQSLNALVEKGIFEIFEEETSRLEHFSSDELISFDLSPVQEHALTQIKADFEDKDVSLLHGVTSSGKTEVYIKLIREVIEKGQQVLYLLPEIALTTQIINRLRKHFGDLVGVYHSKFNNNERAEIWNEVQHGRRFPIVLGTRSSIFLPFNNLGLIIVDEEHENTFKQQQPSPRYNARDTVIKYGQLLNAKVLLASATPSIESYYNALLGKYGLVELNERYGGVKMPEIEIEDIKYVTHRKQMKGAFSPKLLQSIEVALSKNEQVILFQNRRGFAPVSECKSCGWTAKCVSCDVSLTYHKHQEVLKCHYCGYSEQPVKKCKPCGSLEVMIKGYGTEKIEEELQPFFPDAIIKRLDLDTTRKKHAYDGIIHDFENSNIDILIGTQMITKGLDFNNVSLVGIVNADSLLNYPDFRSHERSYQLMAQVSGRSGRKSKQGKVVVQTYSAEHEIIKSVKNNDYKSMYEAEIAEREVFNYPPFCKLISITISHKDYQLTNKAARELAIHLREAFGNSVLGPEYPVVSRVKNRYLKNIVLKIGKNLSLNKSKKHLLDLVESLNKLPDYTSVRFTIDVDPS
ncbi:primosomal protein N' [Flavobacteriales bacterium]|nr:primosomal protein N' [Flavobacteriales bacterium]MDA7794528.1 primosomal protein N' [Flavobacteriales bacterium]